MQKLLNRFSLMTLLSVFLLFSCNNDDDNSLTSSNVSLVLTSKLSDDIQSAEILDMNYIFKELNTGKTTEKSINGTKELTIDLPTGTYEISVSGKINYELDGTKLTKNVTGYIASEAITLSDKTKSIQLFIKSEKSDLMIEEIFFTGTVTPEGKQYLGDRYFKIHNNSDDILYADGLLIIQSEFMTVEKQDYRPNIMATDFAAGSIIMLPGSGKEYPIKPGESIIIAEDAINHKEYNPNSIDLRNANFEIYDEEMDDVDNPSVKNTISIFSSMTMHNRGFTSYAIARLPEGMTVNQYISEYNYSYEYDFVYDGQTFPMSNDAYRVPNDWIIDAVNLSAKIGFQWIVTAPSLDIGWTYCSSNESDSARYGKSVRRKILSVSINGSQILVDTNNSTIDFIPQAKPSLFN